MVALFVVFMIALFLMVDVVLHLKRQPAVAEQFRSSFATSPGLARVAGFRIAHDAALHPGHTWARHAGKGTAQVGLDDFAGRLVGKPDRVELPAVGTRVRAGRPLLTLERNGRRIPVVSPVSGVISAVNRAVQGDPGELVADPYGKGWLVEINSSELAYDLRALMSGEMARRFMDEAAAALHAYFAPPELARAAADGGEPLAGIGDMLDDPTWDRVRSRFLLTDPQ